MANSSKINVTVGTARGLEPYTSMNYPLPPSTPSLLQLIECPLFHCVYLNYATLWVSQFTRKQSDCHDNRENLDAAREGTEKKKMGLGVGSKPLALSSHQKSRFVLYFGILIYKVFSFYVWLKSIMELSYFWILFGNNFVLIWGSVVDLELVQKGPEDFNMEKFVLQVVPKKLFFFLNWHFFWIWLWRERVARIHRFCRLPEDRFFIS